MASSSQGLSIDRIRFTNSACQHCGCHSTGSRSQFSAQDSEQTSMFSRQSTTSASPRRFVMAYRSRIIKLSVLAFFSLLFMGVYVTYFKHPPADVLLRMNQKASGDFGNDFGAASFRKPGKGKNADVDDQGVEENIIDITLDGDADEGDTEIRHSKRELSDETPGKEYWARFLKQNNYVAIGAVYDKCEGSKTQLGTVILEEDKEFGGVKSKTFLNLTVEEEINGGQFHIEVKYNGQDLYDNYWEICELEEDLPVANRTFSCPIQVGKWSKVKEKHVPSYLPTGRYQTKAWAVDDSEKIIACGFSDFKI